MKRIIPIIIALSLALSAASCGEKQDTANQLSEPIIRANEKLPGGQETIWQCVYFGEYPTTEVVEDDFTAVEEYAIKDGDLIHNKDLYIKLTSAEWENDETQLDGERYRRIRAIDAASYSQNREQHYKWESEDSYHYFKYEPIKWRVLEVNGNEAMLVADRQPDCAAYNTKAEDVYWESCTLRSFLNGYGAEQNSAGVSFTDNSKDSFYATAFSDEEKQALVKSEVKNPNNYYFGTECGNATEDYVFIMDEEEVFSTKAAARHGFTESDGINDCARRFQPTMYAKARGAWYSPLDGNKGNGFWLLRTSGYTPSNVNYICDFGAVYNRGTYVTVNDAGVVPVIRVDIDKAGFKNAGTVSSAEIYKETQSNSKASNKDINVPRGNTSSDNAYNLSEPIVEKDESLSSGLKTTWDCIYYGSYPTSEVVEKEFSAVDDYAVKEGDVIVDKALYSKLVSSEWTNDETELDGAKYRRIKAADAVTHSDSREQHYKWDSEDSYHYFKYEPIKWRVLEINGTEALLLADREADCAMYNTKSVDVHWSDCTLRSFLNGYDGTQNSMNIDFSSEKKDSFYNAAFTNEEKQHIIKSKLTNPDNGYYGTDSGADTEDYVFILSGEEVFAGENAARHGFYAGSGVDDPAKRFKPTMYAMARGTWYSPVDAYKGNGFWFMRTNGYNTTTATYICDFGYIYNRGTDVTCDDSGILPALRLDLSAADFVKTEPVATK